MDFLILFYGLTISISVIAYVLLVFRLADWFLDKNLNYLFFSVWLMGYIGVPTAVVISIVLP